MGNLLRSQKGLSFYVGYLERGTPPLITTALSMKKEEEKEKLKRETVNRLLWYRCSDKDGGGAALHQFHDTIPESSQRLQVLNHPWPGMLSRSRD